MPKKNRQLPTKKRGVQSRGSARSKLPKTPKARAGKATQKARARKKKPISPPAKPLAKLLPLLDSNFTWERFEEFSHHLISMQDDVASVHRYGAQGSDQRGIDLAAKLSSGKECTYQCRQLKKFGKADVNRTVSENSYPASRHTILVACVVGTPVRDAIKEHKQWRLWDTTDIALQVRKLDPENARLLVASHFGPEWVREFLGQSVVPTFVSPGLFYESFLEKKHYFHHALALVGRVDELKAIEHFVNSTVDPVFILSGVGGSGKSRLVVELFASLVKRQSNWHVRVVNEGMPVTADAARELPIGDCLIIVEDAHRRSDIPALLTLSNNRPGKTKLLFVTRTHAIKRLQVDLSWTGFAQITSPPRDLEKLNRGQMEELARKALGSEHAEHAEALAQAAGDSPLVLVVAAHLLRTAAVDPRLLERHEEFQRVVLDRFAAESSAIFVQDEDREIARKLLPVIAAIQPIAPANPQTCEALGRFVNASAPTVARLISEFEKAGVLLRRGGMVRIVPDVLADHILHSACVTHAGEPTGYVDQLFTAFQSSHELLLRNLAELDWRLRATTSGRSTVLDAVWVDIRKEFENAAHSGRAQILKILHDVAYLQPDRAFEIVKYAIDNSSEVSESGYWGPYFAKTYSHATVRRYVPPVLHQIAHHLEYLPECCEILWKLARDDTSPTNPNPGHALRLLSDLADFAVGKPVAVQSIVLDAVERWMAKPDVGQRAHSPLDVLDHILLRSGITHRSAGREVQMRAFGVNRVASADVRDRAIRDLRAYVDHSDLKVAIRAISSVAKLLAGVHLAFGQTMDDGFYDQWIPERVEAVGILSQVLSQDDPILKLAAIDALRPFAIRRQAPTDTGDGAEDGEIGTSARDAIKSVNEDYDFKFIRELRQNNFWEEMDEFVEGADDFSKRHEVAQKRLDERVTQVARDFLLRNPTVESAIGSIEAASRRLRDHAIEPQPWRLLSAIGRLDSRYAIALGALAIERQSGDISAQLAGLLGSLGPEMRDESLRLAEQAAASPDIAARIGAAHWLGNLARSSLSPRDLSLLHQLAQDVNPAVRLAALQALAFLCDSDPSAALQLALSVRVDEDLEVCDRLFLWLTAGKPPGPLGIATDAQLTELASKLRNVPSIGDHSVMEFINYSSQRIPEIVLSLLTARIQRQSEQGYSKDFDAIPHNVQSALRGLTSHPRYAELLREVADKFRMAAGVARMDLQRIFDGMSHHFTRSEAMQLLGEMAGSEDIDVVVSASVLFRTAGQTGIFANTEFVISILKCASAIGQNCLRTVRSELYAAAISEGRTGTPGIPFQADVTLKQLASGQVQTLPLGSPERDFFESLVKSADGEIRKAIEEGELLDEEEL